MRLRTATYSVAGAITVCSLLFVWVPSLESSLSLSSTNQSVSWFPTLLTNGFICLDASPVILIVLVGLIAFFNLRKTQQLWWRYRWRLIVALLLCFLTFHFIQSMVFKGQGWGYLSAMILTIWLGSALEQRWGSRRLILFSAMVALIPQVVGFLLVSFTTSQPGLMGSHPLFNGWMTALCLMFAHQRIPALNIKSQHLIWVLVFLDSLALVLDGSYAGLMGLVGTGIAWVLVSGRWRPERIVHWWRRARDRRRRSRFRVIDGG
ncbi:MAG: DUF1751 domain-containing protein [Bradymonadia bacterium]